jgi:glutaredoxin
MPDPRLVLYFEPMCDQCEKAKDILERVKPYEKFQLEEVDITQDPVAYGLHYHDVPVVSINGQVVFRHNFTEDRLIRRVKNARREMEFEEEERRKELEKQKRPGYVDPANPYGKPIQRRPRS